MPKTTDVRLSSVSMHSLNAERKLEGPSDDTDREDRNKLVVRWSGVVSSAPVFPMPAGSTAETDDGLDCSNRVPNP